MDTTTTRNATNYGILSLPIEIQGQILSNLSLDEQVRAIEVCPIWHLIITADPGARRKRYTNEAYGSDYRSHRSHKYDIHQIFNNDPRLCSETKKTIVLIIDPKTGNVDKILNTPRALYGDFNLGSNQPDTMDITSWPFLDDPVFYPVERAIPDYEGKYRDGRRLRTQRFTEPSHGFLVTSLWYIPEPQNTDGDRLWRISIPLGSIAKWDLTPLDFLNKYWIYRPLSLSEHLAPLPTLAEKITTSLTIRNMFGAFGMKLKDEIAKGTAWVACGCNWLHPSAGQQRGRPDVCPCSEFSDPGPLAEEKLAVRVAAFEVHTDGGWHLEADVFPLKAVEEHLNPRSRHVWYPDATCLWCQLKYT